MPKCHILGSVFWTLKTSKLNFFSISSIFRANKFHKFITCMKQGFSFFVLKPTGKALWKWHRAWHVDPIPVWVMEGEGNQIRSFENSEVRQQAPGVSGSLKQDWVSLKNRVTRPGFPGNLLVCALKASDSGKPLHPRQMGTVRPLLEDHSAGPHRCHMHIQILSLLCSQVCLEAGPYPCVTD